MFRGDARSIGETLGETLFHDGSNAKIFNKNKKSKDMKKFLKNVGFQKIPFFFEKFENFRRKIVFRDNNFSQKNRNF